MDDESFARELAAWIDPLVLLECARRYEVKRELALNRATLFVGSGRLAKGDDGAYAELVRKFLRGFSMPLAVIDLMRDLFTEPPIPDDSWRWLAQLSICTDVEVCARQDPPEGAPPNTILFFEERDAVIDLLRAPVLALLDLVDRLAIHWREVASLSAAIFHEPNMPTPFYAYVDREVGSSFLTFIQAPHTSGQLGPKLRYRAVTVYGCPDPKSPIWEVARQAAERAASSTHEPPSK